MLYICENNMYAAQTAAAETHAMPDVAGRAAGYGIPGIVVDGNDIFAIHQAAARGIARARAGEGPTLIECKTYRWRAHTERIGQPDFRTEAEIEVWKKKDPIARLREQLQAQGAMTDADWQAMHKEVLATIGGAVAFAEASPFPAPEQALEDMYAA
jgi:pyruvate dehydrogenase E1 component alpha subunit